jgi:lysophospholipase L1-like esterase
MGAEAVDRLGATRRVMNGLCDELGLTCFDTLDVLQESARRGEHLYYTEDMHLNPYGNAVLADLVIGWLRELGIIE